MINATLNAADSVFIALEKIEEFDYVAFGEKAIRFAATTSAIVVGLCSYIWLALQLFWEDHGDTILTFAFQTIVHTADFAHACYTSARAFRRTVGYLCGSAVDRLYYLATAQGQFAK